MILLKQSFIGHIRLTTTSALGFRRRCQHSALSP